MTKTVRVRIAVAVNRAGRWNATGWRFCDDPMPDDELMAMASEGLDTIGERITFIEADVPMPEDAAIEAEVVEPSACGECNAPADIVATGQCPQCGART